MFSCLRDPEMRTNSYVFQRTALVFTLLSIAVATGCGSSNTSHSPAPSASPGTLNVSASLPTATVGSSYSGAVSATGGTIPYKFSVSSGQLPGGVRLMTAREQFRALPAQVEASRLPCPFPMPAESPPRNRCKSRSRVHRRRRAAAVAVLVAVAEEVRAGERPTARTPTRANRSAASSAPVDGENMAKGRRTLWTAHPPRATESLSR